MRFPRLAMLAAVPGDSQEEATTEQRADGFSIGLVVMVAVFLASAGLIAKLPKPESAEAGRARERGTSPEPRTWHAGVRARRGTVRLAVCVLPFGGPR
ncbi:hypothetical protein ACSNOJ_11735 [Streptomyces sp. URMC 128]|uniref:hypothetical protein n=1 Tax=Streptomyces sp. URMC 128 TaxID=3423404 RepID=UPI003F1B2B1D